MAKKRTKKTPTEPQVDATQEPTELSPKSKEWNEGVAAGITEEDKAEIFVEEEGDGDIVESTTLSDEGKVWVAPEDNDPIEDVKAAARRLHKEALIAEAQEELDSLVTPVADGGVAGQEVTGGGFSSKKTSEKATNAARRNVNNATTEKVETPKYRINVNGSNSSPYVSSSVKTKVNSNRSGVFKIRKDEPINNAKGTHRE